MKMEETAETNSRSPDTCEQKALGTKNQPSIELNTQENELCTRHPMHHDDLLASPLNYWAPEAPFEAPETSQKFVKKQSKNHTKMNTKKSMARETKV